MTTINITIKQHGQCRYEATARSADGAVIQSAHYTSISAAISILAQELEQAQLLVIHYGRASINVTRWVAAQGTNSQAFADELYARYQRS